MVCQLSTRFTMMFLWFSPSYPMGLFSFFHGCLIIFLWFSSGFPIVFLWFAYSVFPVFLCFPSFPMILPSSSYGFPIVFSWFSYDFPIFPWFSYFSRATTVESVTFCPAPWPSQVTSRCSTRTCRAASRRPWRPQNGPWRCPRPRGQGPAAG